MGEASSFCNRWACQHACKEERERTVRVTEESNTKTDPSSRLASRLIAILEWEEASEQTETAQTACAEAYAKVEPVMQVIVCLRPFTQVGCSLAR